MDERQGIPMDTSRPSDPVEVPMPSSIFRPRQGLSSTDSGIGSFGASTRYLTWGTSASSSRSRGSSSTWSIGSRAIATQTSRHDDDHAFVFDEDDAVFENAGRDTRRVSSSLLPDVVPRDDYDDDVNNRRNRNGYERERARSVTLPLPPNIDDEMSQRARDMGRTLRRLSKEFDNPNPTNQGCQVRRRATVVGLNNEDGGLLQMVIPWRFSPTRPSPMPDYNPERPRRPNYIPLLRIRSQSESDAEPPTPTFDNSHL